MALYGSVHSQLLELKLLLCSGTLGSTWALLSFLNGDLGARTELEQPSPTLFFPPSRLAIARQTLL